mmetsp:Transcript_33472/g.68352  ORF Transcript_33472/g.68352 Transcript_33472/m.68352 type:complete len:92 (-) Transcript_33472:155-430(-)
MLKGEGYSLRDICENSHELQKIKKSMSKTYRKGKAMHKLDEKVESSMRSLGKIVNPGKSRKEKDLLKQGWEIHMIMKDDYDTASVISAETI